jgi:hypothetical protein
MCSPNGSKRQVPVNGSLDPSAQEEAEREGSMEEHVGGSGRDVLLQSAIYRGPSFNFPPCFHSPEKDSIPSSGITTYRYTRSACCVHSGLQREMLKLTPVNKHLQEPETETGEGRDLSTEECKLVHRAISH